jgi:hypothetical protein
VLGLKNLLIYFETNPLPLHHPTIKTWTTLIKKGYFIFLLTSNVLLTSRLRNKMQDVDERWEIE